MELELSISDRVHGLKIEERVKLTVTMPCWFLCPHNTHTHTYIYIYAC